MSKFVPAPGGITQWECVTDDGRTSRLRIDGGWLYRYEPAHREPCMVFVPDTAE